MPELLRKSVPERHPKSELTLSVAPALDTEDDRSAAEAIERQLARIEIARRAGSKATTQRLVDSLIDYVWGATPDGAA